MMSPEYLYIIGNGFDLFHEIPTSYRDFGDYVHRMNPSLYHNISDLFPIMKCDESILWSDFENGLKEIDQDILWQIIMDNLTSYGAGEWGDEDNHRAQHVIKQYITYFCDDLFDLLKTWIQSIEVQHSNRYFYFNQKAKYLTFNYTMTLEEAYHISPSDILHIHGSIEALDTIITGHNLKIIDSKNDFDDIRLFECEQILKKDYFQRTFKPTDHIIRQNGVFFQTLKDIRQVIIIGHSLNRIDLPYFEKIRHSLSSAKWLYYCYNCSDISNCYEVLHGRLKIPYGNITPLQYPSKYFSINGCHFSNQATILGKYMIEDVAIPTIAYRKWQKEAKSKGFITQG